MYLKRESKNYYLSFSFQILHYLLLIHVDTG
jgi:hypothetical protein